MKKYWLVFAFVWAHTWSFAQMQGPGGGIVTGTTYTYSYSGIIPNGHTATPGNWAATGGSTSNAASNGSGYYSCSVVFSTAGSQTVTFLDNNRSVVGTLGVTVTQGCTTPATPAPGTLTVPSICGPNSITVQIPNGPIGVTYYWETTATGTSTTTPVTSSPFPVTTSGTYYIRAKSTTGTCWSVSSVAQVVTITPVPATPLGSEITQPNPWACGPVTLQRPAGKTNYFWQGNNSNGFDNTSSTATSQNYMVSTNNYIYLRAYNAITPTSSTCWSGSLLYNPPVDNPAPPTVPPSNTFCEWNPMTITATNIPSGCSVDWFNPGGTSLATTSGSYTVNLNPGSYVYTVRSISAAHGCLSTPVNVNITVQSNCDQFVNWKQQRSFWSDGSTVAAGCKKYFDGFGSLLQSQIMHVSGTPQVLATQPINDQFNKPSANTLVAPINSSTFVYRHRFATNAQNVKYNSADFDADATIFNPNPVANNGIGTLGWYYSSSNTLEPLTPVTTYPYSRDYTPVGPNPSISYSTQPGDAFKMNGSNTHVSTVERQPIGAHDLDNYFTYRPSTLPPQNQNALIGYKIINTDPDGKKMCSFVDADGNLLATAVLGGSVLDNFTYYYYDANNQRVASTTPNGAQLTNAFVTYYSYSQNGRLIETITPDEGKTQFVFDKGGNIRFSQNDEQRNSTPLRFSYTNYDYTGRLTESGEYTCSGTNAFVFEPMTVTSPAPYSVLNIVEFRMGTGLSIETINAGNFTGISAVLYPTQCSDYTLYQYDLKPADFPAGDSFHPAPHFLPGNLSKTQSAFSRTWYSYDEFGKTEWTIQSVPDLLNKTVDYEYDFAGNLTKLIYQKGDSAESFYHHYTYNNDSQLTDVATSFNGTATTEQAKYYYYLHGPLKRTELGNHIQGIDYTYTIDDQLKSINNADNANDPSHDATGTNGFTPDKFGETLNYYNNDYLAANGYKAGDVTTSGVPDIYGGLIKSAGWFTPVDNSYSNKIYGYTYDNLNRFNNAQWGTVTGSSGSYAATLSGTQYNEGVSSYDKNGNIINLSRKDKTGTALSAYTYGYQANTNRLTSVTNAVSQTTQCVSCAQLQYAFNNYVNSYGTAGLINSGQLISNLNSTLGQNFTLQQYQPALRSCNLSAPYLTDNYNGYISFGQQPQFHIGGSDFTCEAWVRIYEQDGFFYPILSDQLTINPSIPSFSGFLFDVVAGGIELFSQDGTGYGVQLNSIGKLTNNVWHHIVAQRFNGSQIALFIDGVQDGGSSSFHQITTGDIDLNGTSDMKIGKVPANSSLNGLKGSVGNVRLYSRALSVQEIQSNYAAGQAGAPQNQTNLLLWAMLDEGIGNTVSDRSPYHATGTFQGGNLDWAPDQCGGCSNTNAQALCTKLADPGSQFTYNRIGQMTSYVQADRVLNFSYTAAGLVRQVTDGSGNLVEKYCYDDKGDLIRKSEYAAGSPLKTIYYVHDGVGNPLVVYEKNAASGSLTREYPMYGSGRIGMVKMKAGTPCYYYEIDDHLGTVRAVLKAPYPETFSASMEPGAAQTEDAQFVNIEQTRALNITANTAPVSGSYVAALDQTHPIGPGIYLDVAPGDHIHVSVDTYYTGTESNSIVAPSTLGSMAALLFQTVRSVIGDPGALYNAFNSAYTNGFLAGVPVNPSVDINAHLNMIMFDRNYNSDLVNLPNCAIPVPDIPGHNTISFDKDIPSPGYVYIYVDNTTTSPLTVNYDNFTVTQTHSATASGGDYYPFGMPINDRQVDVVPYRYGFQGQYAEKDSLLNQNQFTLRNYEPRYGRWLTPDPYGQFSSPYVGMGNIPTTGVDPDGGVVDVAAVLEEANAIKSVGAVLDAFTMAIKLEDAGQPGYLAFIGLASEAVFGEVNEDPAEKAKEIIKKGVATEAEPFWTTVFKNIGDDSHEPWELTKFAADIDDKYNEYMDVKEFSFSGGLSVIQTTDQTYTISNGRADAKDKMPLLNLENYKPKRQNSMYGFPRPSGAFSPRIFIHGRFGTGKGYRWQKGGTVVAPSRRFDSGPGSFGFQRN